MSARAHASLEPAGAAEERYGSQVFDMRWLMEFYHERRGILARYGIEAPLPGAAVVLGRRALLAEHPPIPTRGRPSLFKQAQGVEGQDPSGWILYRIVRTTSPASAEDDPHAVTGTVIGELNTEVAVD